MPLRIADGQSEVSAVIRRRDQFGVLLDYYPDRPGPHHTELRFQPSGRLRGSVITAEREIRVMRIMLDALDAALSDIALDRFETGLRTVEAALNLVRDELGLYVDQRSELHE